MPQKSLPGNHDSNMSLCIPNEYEPECGAPSQSSSLFFPPITLEAKVQAIPSAPRCRCLNHGLLRAVSCRLLRGISQAQGTRHNHRASDARSGRKSRAMRDITVPSFFKREAVGDVAPHVWPLSSSGLWWRKSCRIWILQGRAWLRLGRAGRDIPPQIYGEKTSLGCDRGIHR